MIHEFHAGVNASEINEQVELAIDESSWVVARAYEKNDQTARLAHTNPIYIEIGEPMKPKRESATFYADWCRELLAASEADSERYENAAQRNEVEEIYRQAVGFYERFMK